MHAKYLKIALFFSVILIAGCASSPSQPIHKQSAQAIPPSSPFAKLKVGMSSKQAHDLIGEPTDTANHMTGKMFIPFYFGNDAMRMVELYKGQGRIIYTGVGIGSMNFNIYQIEYDPTEDGYNNKE